MLETIEAKGLFSSFYSDRGAHYWVTPTAGRKVDKQAPTQFGRAMRHLGIEMIPAYSPQARGRSERQFKTLQDRLPKELALANMTEIGAANAFLKTYWPRYNDRFAVPAAEAGTAFVPVMGVDLKEILCIQEHRSVRADNCINYRGKVLQIPQQQHRQHFIKARVRVHEYPDRNLAIFHGPRCLARYTSDGQLLDTERTTRRKRKPRKAA